MHLTSTPLLVREQSPECLLEHLRTGCGETGKGGHCPKMTVSSPSCPQRAPQSAGRVGWSAPCSLAEVPHVVLRSQWYQRLSYTHFHLWRFWHVCFICPFFAFFSPSIHHPDSTISKVLSLCFCLYLSFFNWLKYFKAKLVVIAEN